MNQLVRSLVVEDLTILPLTPTIGAEIEGVDLTRPLSEATVSALRRALLDWKVLFFRDQEIDTGQHLAFARRFGELEVHPFAPQKPGYPEVLAITHDEKSRGRENTWHSDVTWRLEPSLGSILRALEVPPVGGDTLFADMYAAYEGLTDEVKARIEGALAVHDFENFRRGMRKRGVSEAEIEAFDKLYPTVEHPVVRTHPETGRKALYVNFGHTMRFAGMTEEESRPLLEFLFAHQVKPEFTCRFIWKVGDIAFWDNRCVLHNPVNDYHGYKRSMHRVTLKGDRPR